jgi:hypothetical protein
MKKNFSREMDDFDDIFLDFEMHRHDVRDRQVPAVIDRRMNPFLQLSDAEFKRNYRLDKTSVVRLTDMLRPALHRASDRGWPLTAEQEVCIGLLHYAGGQFQRISALCGGISQATVWRSIQRVTHAICELKDEFIR